MALNIGIENFNKEKEAVEVLDVDQELLAFLEDNEVSDQLAVEDDASDRKTQLIQQATETLLAIDALITTSSDKNSVAEFVSKDPEFVSVFGTDSAKWHDNIQSFIKDNKVEASTENFWNDFFVGGPYQSWWARRTTRLIKGINNGINQCAKMSNDEVDSKIHWMRALYLPEKDACLKKIKALQLMLQALKQASTSVASYKPEAVVSKLNDLGVSNKRMDPFNFNSIVWGSVLGMVIEKTVDAKGWDKASLVAAFTDMAALLNETGKSVAGLKALISTKALSEKDQSGNVAKLKHINELAKGYVKGVVAISRGLANVGFRLSSTKLSLQGALTTYQ